MSNVPAKLENKTEQVIMQGDLSKLSTDERLAYVNNVCSTLGLNPLTRPFDYITFQGRLVLYARKDCAEQLRKIHGVSITDMKVDVIDGICIVRAKAKDKNGKEDESTGAVPIEGLKGADKANAMMKAETKAKRRVTLSICGLGILDESDIEDASESDRTPQAPAALAPSEPNEGFAEKVNALLGKFRKIGVSEKMICDKYGIEAAFELDDSQVDELNKIGAAIVREGKKITEFFEVKA